MEFLFVTVVYFGLAFTCAIADTQDWKDSLRDAIIEGDKNVVEELVQNRDLTDLREPWPLHTACFAGEEEIVEVLLKNSADINIENSNGETPLQLAVNECSDNYHKIVNVLLENDVEVNHKNSEGKSALHLASMNGCEKIIKSLLEMSADINEGDINGNTALIFATKNGHLNVVRILIKKGADLNLGDNNEFTALHWTAFNGFVNIANLLINKGADLNVKNNQGLTPYDLAVENLKPFPGFNPSDVSSPTASK